MILRSLSIFGFKSFADKIDIDFGNGMTAIVGPNGCGKSNVVDAIRWVFGEQKPSALRSAAMQDVIFSGSQKRQPLNMSEVTLTIDNNRGMLPTEYGHVAITRRLYRTGESEYRLNKVPCRLRDIQELFLDTGLGSSAYTTIENNMINQILSDKADERRILFDEAAGVGKYKHRRRDSQKQLERTRQDLLRINDKVQEADRQVRMLARHVEKARRYKKYHDELKTLEVGFEKGRYARLTASCAALAKQLEELGAARETVRAKISALEAAIEQKRLAALDKENELQTAAAAVGQAGEQINDIDREISLTLERRGAMEEKLQRFGREVETLAAQMEEKNGLKMQIEKSMIERGTRLEQCSEKVGRSRDELDTFDGRIADVRRESGRLAAEQIECINAVAEIRNDLSNLRAHLSNTLEKTERAEREIAALEASIQEHEEKIAQCRVQLCSVGEARERYLQSRETLAARIEKEDELYRIALEKEKRHEAQIDADKAQLRFLAGLDAAFEGYEAGVKSLLSEKIPGVHGVVADCMAIADEPMIPVIERALGAAIQTVVCENDEALRAAMTFLGSRNTGSARMLSLERLARTARLPAAECGGATALRSFVTTDPRFAPLADRLLGGVFLADGADRAMELALAAGPSAVFVTRDGLVCSGDGSVVAGDATREQAGLLQRKNQIEKLQEEIGRLEKTYQQIVHDKEICIINRDEAKFALVEIDEKITCGRQEQQEQETTIRHLENETTNVRGRLDGLRQEHEQARGRVQELEDRISRDEAELATRQSRLAQLEQQVEESRAGLAAMEEERKTLSEHFRNLELEMQGLTNRIDQDRRDVDRLTKEIAGMTGRRNGLLDDQRTTAAAIEEQKRAVESLHGQLERQKERREELAGGVERLREAYNAMTAETDEIRKTVRSGQAEMEQAGNAFHEVELHRERDEQDRRRIRERIWEVYELDIESSGDEIAALGEADPAVAENIEMLRERLKRVGQVNMAALEDFDTENQRLQELAKQRDDLQTAVDDLEKAIKKLDREARVQFVEVFEQVQKNFVGIFTTLFEGGEASMSLEENADPLEALININVRSAGKKMRGIQLLSGGERALTAIALLFSLYKVKPSAYCILDEIDAPLDDANVERFLRLLRSFALQTQFIVVTHNKRTMEAADILYGVTQQERGVSTIVSVKIEQAIAGAA